MKSKEELLKEFIGKAKAACANVISVAGDPSSIKTALQKITEGENEILVSNPGIIERSFFEQIFDDAKYLKNFDKGKLRNAKTGITPAVCGIASAGSVIVPISDDLTSYISMLVRNHIVILDGNKIVSRPRELFDEENIFLQGSYSIITGPSATADMGPLVRGVHGPGKLHIIVTEGL
ncbi:MULTISPECIES: LUD domain-containing protein [Melioribacter]|nr:LUD domain-containing protein [Melioribacter roseus]